MKRVLVVDDTKNIRLLLTKCLEMEDCTVTAAENGQEALSILQKKSFDLAFLDVRMPEISGTEVLRKMRDNGITTPVIMMTAFGTVKNAVECTQLGAVAYLQKPFTANKVHQVMQTLLQHVEIGTQGCSEVLQEADDYIQNAQLDQAESALKNALPRFFMQPGIYRKLAELYNLRGEIVQARTCQSLADSLAAQNRPEQK